ncbi:ferredoxin reductase family protein [Paractinoplanes brasiliensis]|uniref:Putative ferric reductase n=1 Tax=Paractinoplanes brasiliensis TaxID=52695 RepID=A0A4R6K2F9_9ACTN|nr:ferredoxin reductase family protein [Actinoplanes brasiliensis]TDO42341.1 putative ferric reductase [Actinoplanes brasiliensis]GID29573.1 oxidoreductase [Actinoplanes brasiliensis]
MITATPQRVSRTGQAGAAYVMLWAFLVLNLAIVELMLANPSRPAYNTLVQIGRVFGMHLAFALALQLLLIARLPFLDRRIGMDKLTTWHRWTGFTIFWLVLLHPTFVMLGYARLENASFLSRIPALGKQMPVLLGMIAAGLIGVIAVTSIRAARRRFSYEVWHTIHLLVYTVIVLGVIHQVYEGSAFKTNNFTQAYWWGLWIFAIGALITGRLLLPLVRNLRHRLRVAAVVSEADDVVSVHVTGRNLHKLHARAGQFFLWRFPGHNRWWQVNPWSLSAAPDGHSLRLTAKAIGRTSAGLRQLPVGTRVFAEGPYGAFTAAARTRQDTVLIAGGIGITPIRALFEDETLSGDIVVLYRVRTPADAVLLGELRNLAALRHARLHVLTGRTGPDNQPFSPAGLLALVPDITERDVFVCGPGPMTNEVLRSLKALKVPARQRHAEQFRLAA